MLIGRPPFQVGCKNDSAAAIMQRIKNGDFCMENSDWDRVSEEAKKLIKGMYLAEEYFFSAKYFVLLTVF